MYGKGYNKMFYFQSVTPIMIVPPIWGYGGITA
jgi:hypothetical protein